MANFQKRPGGQAYFVAQLRELASLGIWQAHAAILLGTHTSQVSTYAKRYGIVFSKRTGETWFRRQIREGIAQGLRPKDLALKLNTTKNCIVATTHQMGLDFGNSGDPYKFQRPFVLPDDRRDEYRALRDLGLTMIEAGVEMKLLPREKPKNVRRPQF